MMSELGVNVANGDGDRGKALCVTVVVVVVSTLFSNSSLPMSYKLQSEIPSNLSNSNQSHQQNVNV
jgi:hypothetical protein